MKSTTKALPVIRVTKLPPGAKKEAVNRDVQMFETLMAIVNASNRVRARVDGVEARLARLETLCEDRGSR